MEKDDSSVDQAEMEMEQKGVHDPQGSRANLLDLLKEMTWEVLHGDEQQSDKSVLQRSKAAIVGRAPRFRLAAKSASLDVMHWMHRGGPWRAFLVTVVGIIIFVAMAAMATFALFLVTATVNTVAIGFLMSVSSVGAFMATFFMILTAIYIGALVVAALAISSIAFFTIAALLVSAAWIGFFWLVWQAARKGLDICRGSLVVTASTLSALSAAGSTQIIAIEKRSA